MPNPHSTNGSCSDPFPSDTLGTGLETYTSPHTTAMSPEPDTNSSRLPPG